MSFDLPSIFSEMSTFTTILQARAAQMIHKVSTLSDKLRATVVPALEAIHEKHRFDLSFTKPENMGLLRNWAFEVARDLSMHDLVSKVPTDYIPQSVSCSLLKKIGESKREHGLIKAMWKNMIYVREFIVAHVTKHHSRGHTCLSNCPFYERKVEIPPPQLLLQDAAPWTAEAFAAELIESFAESPVQVYVMDPTPEWEYGLYYTNASDRTQAAQASAAEVALLRELLAPRSSVPCPDAAAAAPILPAEADDDAEEEDEDTAPAARPRWNRLYVGPHPDCLAEEVRCRNCAAAVAPCDDCAQAERFNRI